MGVEKSVMYFFLFVEVADLHVCYILYRGSNLTAFPLHFKRDSAKNRRIFSLVNDCIVNSKLRRFLIIPTLNSISVSIQNLD